MAELCHGVVVPADDRDATSGAMQKSYFSKVVISNQKTNSNMVYAISISHIDHTITLLYEIKSISEFLLLDNYLFRLSKISTQRRYYLLHQRLLTFKIKFIFFQITFWLSYALQQWIQGENIKALITFGLFFIILYKLLYNVVFSYYFGEQVSTYDVSQTWRYHIEELIKFINSSFEVICLLKVFWDLKLLRWL